MHHHVVGFALIHAKDAAEPPMNVLIILGHPRKDSFCAALADAYRAGAEDAGVNVRWMALADMAFEPHVHEECPSEQELEEDLRRAKHLMEWADHMVFVYPNWWGTMPALLKGFFDRLLFPGFAFFHYEEDEGQGWEKLLRGKTAELISTMDMPPWVFRWIYREPGNNAIKRATLRYVGVRTTRITNLGVIKDSTPEDRQAWLERARRLGESLHDGPETPGQRLRRRTVTWLKALRLQFYPMTWVAYTIGSLAVAGSTEVFSSGLYWLGFLFLFFLEAATVLSNEYFDYPTDLENTFHGPFTGGSRVLVNRELSFDEVKAGFRVCLLLTGISAGGVLVLSPSALPSLIVVMATVAVLALGYTIPPLKLAYRTLGELTVGITHSIGGLICGFVFLGGPWHDPFPWLVSLPLLIGTLPSITLAGIPDARADRQAGKETVAVRFGTPGAAIIAASFAWLAALVAVSGQLLDLLPQAYGPVIYLCIPHAALLSWMSLRYLRHGGGVRRIDGLMVASLTYVLWFGLLPLINLI